MNVFLRLKPTAIMSFALLRENLRTSSTLSSCLNKNFSSSETEKWSKSHPWDESDSPVSWMTNGTSKTSCNHLFGIRTRKRLQKETYFVKTNGIMCPICTLSLLGPRPVYKKNGFPCSYRSRIRSKSLRKSNRGNTSRSFYPLKLHGRN